MTLTQLEYILAVDTHRSFARAAKHCFVTQPTLSMQIKKVEEELNVLIFDRSKKPVLTTDIGEKIVEQARISIREVRRINEVIQAQKDELNGDLRVGIIPTLSSYLIPLFITHFSNKYPNVTLVLEELLSKEIIFKLNNDQLDVGIMASPVNAKSMIEIPVFYENFMAYFSKKHPLAKQKVLKEEDLNLDEMWLMRDEHCFRSQVLNICKDKRIKNFRNIRFESGNLETLKRLVDRQDGYTLLPELATLYFNKQEHERLRSFQNPKPVREISLVIHRSYMKEKLINVLKSEILKTIPKHMLENKLGKLIPLDS